MLSVKTNLMAMNADRQLRVNTGKNRKTTEKLSSGYKINRAADDAAGLSVSEKMRRQIRGLHQGAENIQEGIGYVQTADGALNEAADILQRINQLSVKAANGTNTAEDRAHIDREIQQLKAELGRIFQTTEYNERRIWESNHKELVGWEKRQAVTFSNTSGGIDVTNDNCGVIACGSYKIHADADDGVYIDWIGYDGNTYQTQTVGWEELKKNNYRLEMSDYFGEKTADNLLYDAAGQPVFKHEIALSVADRATIEDVVKCIDGKTFSSSPSAHMSGRFEDLDGNAVSSSGVSVYSVSLNYSAAYASNHNTGNDSSTSRNVHDFDAADDAFLEPRGKDMTELGAGVKSNLTTKPKASNVAEARDSADGWEFTFYMDGIGKVTATLSSTSYGANDRTDDDEGLWWSWQSSWVNGKWVEHAYKSGISRSAGDTLGGIMGALTGGAGSGSPGLLTAANGGCADSGGYINLSFTIKSQDSFAYGDGQSGNSVGSVTFRVSVSSSDTEQSILQKIQDAFNDDTIFDFYTPNGSSGYGQEYFGTATATAHEIDAVEIYGGEKCSFFVEAGPEAGEHISIEYEALDLEKLGMKDTNALTVKDAGKAIDEVKQGLQIINRQRSDFGAYQNRLERAYKINSNSEENTQSAESEIRDTDIADEMTAFSNQNILMQAGISMLAQANQKPQSALQLLS